MIDVNAQLTTGSFGGGTGSLYYSNSAIPIGTAVQSVSASSGSTTINMSNQLMNLDARLKDIEARLCILVPDPLLLEKYQSLQDAYNHYKLMEKLLTENS